MIKSLWASVQGDPVFMRRVNGWLTLFWLLMIPVSIVTGWITSVTYVAALSLWALVSGHWSAWQAARVEVRQEEDANVQEVKDLIEEKLSGRPAKRVMGIDPGLTGALAFLNADGVLEELEDMPRLDKMVNASLLSHLIQGYGPIYMAVVEQAQTMPRKGAGAERSRGTAGAFNYGVSYGIIVGILATLEIPSLFVAPSVWKRKAGLTSDKTLSRRRATERWPERANDFKRVSDDGRAEAALLAEWWRASQPGPRIIKRRLEQG